MKGIRPFGWVIIALNAYFFVSFFVGLDPNDSETVVGLSFIFLIFWLAIMNTFLYVLYRITGGKKRECPACGVGVNKGLVVCPSCKFDFKKAASGEAQPELTSQEIQEPLATTTKSQSELSKKFKGLHPALQSGIALVLITVGLYVITWLLAPYSEYMDNALCGLNSLANIQCTFRYQG